MAKLSLKQQASANKLLRFYAEKQDGTGAFTGLLYNTAGLTAYYIREGDTATTAITLVTGGTLGTWAAGTLNPVDATNMPGVYEMGLPNAGLAAGKSVTVVIRGVTNMADVLIEIELTAVDNQSANASITGINGLAPPVNWNLLAIDGSGRISTTYGIHKNVLYNAFAFLMTDSTLHNPATGKTVTATRSLDGAAFGSCANSVAELANGVYLLNLAASDLNAGTVVLRLSAASCDDTFVTLFTQS